ncbi:MAG TPA: dipeptide epimerase [Chitinophagaceae bacterium]|nr:dipeptide epimerase [Chitinophagaceae bacterium]
MIDLSWQQYMLRLKHVFRISRGARSEAPLVITRLRYGGKEGIGEGSFPPLYGESWETAEAFLSKVDLSDFKDPFDTESILSYVDQVAPGNQAAKTSIDIALHDLIGKLLNIPVHSYFGLAAKRLATSMTIGIDTPEEMARKAKGYSSFKYLKIKLGTDDDKSLVEAIRAATDKPLFIDANQAWSEKEKALDFIHWLKEKNVVFIEQPMPKDQKQDQAWLTQRSPLPIIGDEGFQRLSSLREASMLYHGINIKLMKSTGLREGFKMAVAAKALGMKVMLGCMSETSCAISAASQLGALADWVDLDGNLDADNDPFEGTYLEDGMLVPTSLPGVGLREAAAV